MHITLVRYNRYYGGEVLWISPLWGIIYYFSKLLQIWPAWWGVMELTLVKCLRDKHSEYFKYYLWWGVKELTIMSIYGYYVSCELWILLLWRVVSSSWWAFIVILKWSVLNIILLMYHWYNLGYVLWDLPWYILKGRFSISTCMSQFKRLGVVIILHLVSLLWIWKQIWNENVHISILNFFFGAFRSVF